MGLPLVWLRVSSAGSRRAARRRGGPAGSSPAGVAGVWTVAAVAWMGLTTCGALTTCSAADESSVQPRHQTDAGAPVQAARVLILTGEDYEGHKWRETTPVLRRQLETDRRLRVDVIDELGKAADAPLADYRAVVLHFKNYDPNVPSDEARRRLERYVRGGGGLVLVHFACGAFQEWPGFVELAGRVWNPKLRGHDPYGVFRVEIAAPDHPIMRGLKPFDIRDELYTCLDGDVPITVLATARSKIDGKDYPMAFVLKVGEGRAFHCVLGHDTEALGNAGAGALMRRGTAWAAGLEPGAPEP